MIMHETLICHEEDLKWELVVKILVMQQYFFQPHALYRDIVLYDGSNHPSLEQFHVMAGSTLHAGVPICCQSGSTHFS
jgi:hypothetical protein